MADPSALEARLAELAAAFHTAAGERMARIAADWAVVAVGVPETTAQLRERLLNDLHFLAGAAGSFGRASLGRIAHSVEVVLRRAADRPLSEQLCDQVGAALAALEREIATIPDTAAPTLSATEAAVPGGHDLLVWGLPEHLVHRLERRGRAVGIAVRPIATADATTLGGAGLVVADLAVVAAAGPWAQRPPLVVCAPEDTLERRLEAMRLGAVGLDVSPLDTDVVFEYYERHVSSLVDEPIRVMVVDDEPLLAGYVCDILRHAGFDVVGFEEPLAAYRALPEVKPDLVLTDMHMPGCDGVELARLIRQLPRYDVVPIVFLSTERDTAFQLKVRADAASDFVTKPIDPVALVALVRGHASRARQLRRMMNLDALTGVYNARAAREQLDRLLGISERAARPLSAAVLDVDHFKSVNDRHGHAVGDKVLKALSQLLRRRLRRGDVVGRIGGEEFMIVLADTGEAAACEVLDDLRQAFGQFEFDAGAGRFQCSFSCGVAEFDPATGAGGVSHRLIDAADCAMYAAKAAGRNRVVGRKAVNRDTRTAQQEWMETGTS